jgi:hypothetical protein
MNKKIYYVIERELATDSVLIRTYVIESGVLKLFFEIETLEDRIPVDEMIYWLDDNGYGNNEYDFDIL